MQFILVGDGVLNALGTHLLLELRECDELRLNDLEYIRDSMISTAVDVGATIVGQTFHKFNPQGVTGVVAIAESHLCIHTWPEFGYAAVDVFTCGSSVDPHQAADLIIQRLCSKNPSVTELKRGPALQFVEPSRV